jgi:DNA-binding MarR family transcriptional regulator
VLRYNGQDVNDHDYRALADFRLQLRRFLAFSEEAARGVGLEPRQHQLLLALRGLPADQPPTVGALAERLVLEHHTVVELIDRMQEKRLIRRTRDPHDRRQARVAISARGAQKLERLSREHRDELVASGPALVKSLRHVLRGAS